MAKNEQAIVIDGQGDFGMPEGLIPGLPSGALYVCQDRSSVRAMAEDPLGGYQAMKRAAKFLKKKTRTLTDEHFTFDKHHRNHVANHVLWQDRKGHTPPPFTKVTEEAVEKRELYPVIGDVEITYGGRIMTFGEYVLFYVRELKRLGRFDLTLWPVHCRADTPGSALVPELSEAAEEFARQRLAIPDFVTKGSNFRTEHYSAVKAEVPDPDDQSGTGLNMPLIKTMEQADVLYWMGIAGDYCLKNTFLDTIANFGKDAIARSVLLLDCIASIDQAAFAAFVKEMQGLGVKACLSTDVM